VPGPARSTLVASLAIAVVVLVLGVRWLGGERGAPASNHPAQSARPGPAAGTGTATRASGADGGGRGSAVPVLQRAPASMLVVHVAGAVRRPGVYRLRDGARVADAVARAGGASRNADQAGVNLAARLTDGQQVLLPRRGAARAPAPPPGAAEGGAGTAADGPAPGAGDAPVSLASATLEQLDALEGIGPVIARKILEWRTKSGGFASVDDLAQIPGIGPKKLAALRAGLVP
jgi:competence protein ComEA